VQGWIDLLDVEGRIVDVKTARARPTSIEPMHRFQVTTYCQLMPGASGKGRIDTLVKTKMAQVVSQSFEVTPDDRRAIQTLYPLAQEAMRAQLYMPNRLAMTCSRRNCSTGGSANANGAVRFPKDEDQTQSTIPCLDSRASLLCLRVQTRD
jgi:hypothetical protein